MLRPVTRRSRAIDADVGTRVRAARAARGWGLREFATQVGMSASALSEFERGRSMPATSRMDVITSALNMPVVRPQQTDVPELQNWREYHALELEPVLQAGLEIFVKYGYHGATVRMIAKRAGLSVAGVYYYVEGKQQLLAVLQQHALSELIARVHAADDESGSPAARLANITEAIASFSIFRQEWALLNSNEIYSLDAPSQARQIRSRLEVRGVLEAAVVAYRKSGLKGRVSAGPTARAIVTMCVAIADWYDAGSSPPPAEILADYVALAHAMVRAG